MRFPISKAILAGWLAAVLISPVTGAVTTESSWFPMPLDDSSSEAVHRAVPGWRSRRSTGRLFHRDLSVCYRAPGDCVRCENDGGRSGWPYEANSRDARIQQLARE